ncbi:hypothetical protein LOTGIDRAFT_231007 [Lottia gigantea]|uniref:ER membrane protein complex subunit 6 n=1 Tax=Lottia gigantea TaxID=225164 RepID=V4AS49_LOTGI|nr:hypothetical protein LOTGIDRAFT_231007 [Lottia gigantea]ESP00083.1 hypothetical protein LOTGIDRAFT_231007 [Lottia gigantea]
MATTIAVRTRKSRKSDNVAYSEMALRQNASILEYCRTSMACLGGASAGILGLTGLYGFAFYFITSILFSVMVLIKAGSRWNNFFVSRKILFTNGLLGALFTYVLSWTFLYGMVHVY